MQPTSVKIAIRLDGVPQAPEQGKRALVEVEYQGQQFIADLNAKSLRKLNKQVLDFTYPAACAIEGSFGGIVDGVIKLDGCGCQVFEKKLKEPKNGSGAKPAAEAATDTSSEPTTLVDAIEQVTGVPEKPDPLARPGVEPEKEPGKRSAKSSGKAKGKPQREQPRGSSSRTSTPPGTYELPPNLLNAKKHKETKNRRAAEPYVPQGASGVGSEPFSVV